MPPSPSAAANFCALPGQVVSGIDHVSVGSALRHFEWRRAEDRTLAEDIRRVRQPTDMQNS